jgi:hypothetical protein
MGALDRRLERFRLARECLERQARLREEIGLLVGERRHDARGVAQLGEEASELRLAVGERARDRLEVL